MRANKTLGLVRFSLFHFSGQFIRSMFKRFLHFKSKLSVLGVYGKLIKSSTSLIRGIFPIRHHFHTHFRLTLRCRQFCVMFIKCLYLEFYSMSRAEIYRAPNRPIDEQRCSFNFCLKMLLRSANISCKVMVSSSTFLLKNKLSILILS